ncbi:MBL fold metallo-hydrolase [Pseudoalteromonas xiamenensis]
MKFHHFMIFALLAGCTSQHRVTVINNENYPVKYAESGQSEEIFSNAYPGKKSYPVTCEKSCYPAHPDLICEEPDDRCHYIGKQISLVLKTQFTVQWLGHASFLIKTPDEQTWLLDPVSGQFDWPVNWAFVVSGGRNRNTPNWPTAAKLEAVNAVFYSHIHYDHFNKSDIQAIGAKPNYFVPLEFSDYFPSGNYNITEMSWYAQTKLGEVNIHFVPANHFSNRMWVPFLYSDYGKTLWGGWVFEHQGKTLYFAGDTGYSKHFKDIQEKYGEIDICLLPIASYFHPEEGNWYRYVHTTPEDALVAAQELGCKVMIPWGYGNKSWGMGDVSAHAPLKRLLYMKERLNNKVPVYILNEGESISL